MLRRIVSTLPLLLLTVALHAYGNDHGGGASAPAPLVFTSNLATAGAGDRILQMTLAFEQAAPEVTHHIDLYKPKIQHKVILLLSGENAETLRTLKGKAALAEKIRDIVNGVLHEDEKSGVTEVLFTSFIIQ